MNVLGFKFVRALCSAIWKDLDALFNADLERQLLMFNFLLSAKSGPNRVMLGNIELKI